MEIEEPQHSRLQSLGFRIPGVNEEKILSIIAKKYKESKIQEDLTREPSKLTADDLTRELRREQIIQNNKNVVMRGDYFWVDSIDPKTLSETEQAFYLSFDPTSKVLSDSQAQLWKNAQPNMKLVGAKETKIQTTTATTTTNPIATPQQKDQSQPINQGLEKSNVVVQSQLVYQLSSTAKDLVITIKDPIILSSNLIEKFCKCQKSYEGELMIKCSNDNCPILWYHPGCVGLGNVNPKMLEDIQFTCEDCQNGLRDQKKSSSMVSTNVGEKGSRKKPTKN